MVRASLIWLNYNSSRFIDIALRSIESILNLDFDDYEVVIVDNASTDGSFEVIRKFVEERKPSGVRVRFVRSDYNRGYTGGMNLGWEARDRDAEYVAFLNNDLIAEPESLRGIIEHMESDEKIAAANGLIYFGDGKTINSAGGYIAEHWIGGTICWGARGIDECPRIYDVHHVTFPVGSYAVVRARAIKEVCPGGKPFIDEIFLYYDDALLGLILWNRGYRVIYVPIKAGLHFESLTTKSSGLGEYWVTRASTALRSILNTRYSWTRPLYIMRRRVGYKLLCMAGRKKYCDLSKAVNDGLRLAKTIEKTLSYRLNLYKAPYVKVSPHELLGDLLLIKKLKLITHEMLNVPLEK